MQVTVIDPRVEFLTSRAEFRDSAVELGTLDLESFSSCPEEP